jgi:hypothetical protein
MRRQAASQPMEILPVLTLNQEFIMGIIGLSHLPSFAALFSRLSFRWNTLANRLGTTYSVPHEVRLSGHGDPCIGRVPGTVARVRLPIQARPAVARRPSSFRAGTSQFIAVSPQIHATSRLKVVLRSDLQQRGDAGRMVISGRMADVCAELERMAQCEAPLQGSAQSMFQP